MRIVFLDFDGVVAPFRPHGVCEPNIVCRDIIETGVVEFDAGCVAELNLICDTGKASIVVSSSWRYYLKSLDICRRVLRDQGCRAPVIGMTPMFPPDEDGFDYSRGAEIRRFLEPLDVQSFVILDDCDMGFAGLESRWVKTKPYVGLTRASAVAALGILETPVMKTA